MNLSSATRHQQEEWPRMEGVIEAAWTGERIVAGALDRAPVGALRPTVHARPKTDVEQIAHFSLFGVSFAVRSNTCALLDALAGLCDTPPVSIGHEARQLDLTLTVDPALTRSAISSPPRVDTARLEIDGADFVVRADAALGRGSCRVSPLLCNDVDRLCGAVLEPLLLFLVARRGRAPLHAAGFVAGDLALLLAGPSGAGKSCLTLAAQRAGFAPLSDDIVFVEAGPDPRVWGLPRPIHLFPYDAPSSEGPVRLRNGKLKTAVVLGGDPAPRHADKAVLCLLHFGDAAALQRLDSVEAVRAFSALEPGFDLLADEIAAAVAALTQNGGWSLTLSDRPDDAIALLADNLPLLRGATR
jgi:hypothetical protein